MAHSILQKAVLYITETQELVLFGGMTSPNFLSVFLGSPLFYIMLPLMALLLVLLAAMNIYQFIHSQSKTRDLWLKFFVSLLRDLLVAGVLISALIVTHLGVTALAGPAIFSVLLFGIGISIIYQSTMLFYNIYHACVNTQERARYLQLSLGNFFLLSLALATAAAIVLVMMTPVAPALGILCATSAALLTSLNILWQITPNEFKYWLRLKLHLAKKGENDPCYLSADPGPTVLISEDFMELQSQQPSMDEVSDYSPLFTPQNEQKEPKSIEEEKEQLFQKVKHAIRVCIRDVESTKEQKQEKISLLLNFLSPGATQETLKQRDPYGLLYSSEIKPIAQAWARLQQQRPNIEREHIAGRHYSC